MDSSKVPVKLVKVTRVLGRTGKHIMDIIETRGQFSLSEHQFLTLYRFSWRCYASQSRVYGRYHPKHHPKRQGTWYEYIYELYLRNG